MVDESDMTDNTDTKGTLNGADSDGDDGKFAALTAILSCPWQFKCYALWIWHGLVHAKITDFLCDCILHDVLLITQERWPMCKLLLRGNASMYSLERSLK